MSAPASNWGNRSAGKTSWYARKASVKSSRYLRRPFGSLARIRRSTPASACSCAALRRDRKLAVLAIVFAGSSMPRAQVFAAPYGIAPLPLLDLPEPASLCSIVPRSGSQRLPQQSHRKQNSSFNVTVATTGASGSIFLQQLLRILDDDQRVATVNFIASDSGLRVLAEELGITGRNNLVEQILGRSSRKIQPQANADIGANVASGS